VLGIVIDGVAIQSSACPAGFSHDVEPAQSSPPTFCAVKDPVNTATLAAGGIPSTSVNVNVLGIPVLKYSEKICACANIVLRTKLRVRSFFISCVFWFMFLINKDTYKLFDFKFKRSLNLTRLERYYD